MGSKVVKTHTMGEITDGFAMTHTVIRSLRKKARAGTPLDATSVLAVAKDFERAQQIAIDQNVVLSQLQAVASASRELERSLEGWTQTRFEYLGELRERLEELAEMEGEKDAED